MILFMTIIQMNCCPNPKCQKKLEKLIIVNENSSSPADFYYACPHCQFKLDPTTTQLFKKEEISIKQKTQTKRKQSKRENPPGCPKYFGYLANGLKDSLILNECLICPKMLDCTREKKDLVRIN